MASAEKTAIGLNQWAISDKPKLADFNADNLLITKEFAKKADLVGADFKELSVDGNMVWDSKNLVVEAGMFDIDICGYENAGTAQYNIGNGRYVKIGRITHVLIHMVGTLSGASGALVFRGLPTVPYGIDALSVGYGYMEGMPGVTMAYVEYTGIIRLGYDGSTMFDSSKVNYFNILASGTYLTHE